MDLVSVRKEEGGLCVFVNIVFICIRPRITHQDTNTSHSH